MSSMRELAVQNAAEAIGVDGPAHAAWSALSRQCDRTSAPAPSAEVAPCVWSPAQPIERLTAELNAKGGLDAGTRRRWRPVGNSDLIQLQRQIEVCLRAWLRAWLPQPGAVRSHIRPRSNAMPGTVRQLLECAGLSMVARNSALTSLAWRALDMARFEHEPAEESTRAIVAAIAEHMGADLKRRLRGGVPSASLAVQPTSLDGNEPRVHRIDIDADQFTSMVEVNVTEDYFRVPLPSPTCERGRDMGDRVRMATALHASTLNLHGVLGTCTLRVGQLMSLQSGDLLVLNRCLRDPLPLFLQGRASGPIARGTVGQIRGRLALKLNHMETRNE